VTDQNRNKAWGFALFADDVRPELGGKLSLMGMYQSDMLFPSRIALPITLPKLVVMIMYYEVHGASDADITFRISYNETTNVLADIPMPRAGIARGHEQVFKQNSEGDPKEDRERVFNLRIPIALSPFHIERMGRLRVRAHYSDGKVLRLGSIGLKQVSDEEFETLVGHKPLS
jgi:hypothetical protein